MPRFQELDLSKEAFIFNDTPKEPEWMKAVFDGLHPGAKYAFVRAKSHHYHSHDILVYSTVRSAIYKGDWYYTSLGKGQKITKTTWPLFYRVCVIRYIIY